MKPEFTYVPGQTSVAAAQAVPVHAAAPRPARWPWVLAWLGTAPLLLVAWTIPSLMYSSLFTREDGASLRSDAFLVVLYAIALGAGALWLLQPERREGAPAKRPLLVASGLAVLVASVHVAAAQELATDTLSQGRAESDVMALGVFSFGVVVLGAGVVVLVRAQPQRAFCSWVGGAAWAIAVGAFLAAAWVAMDAGALQAQARARREAPGLQLAGVVLALVLVALARRPARPRG